MPRLLYGSSIRHVGWPGRASSNLTRSFCLASVYMMSRNTSIYATHGVCELSSREVCETRAGGEIGLQMQGVKKKKQRSLFASSPIADMNEIWRELAPLGCACWLVRENVSKNGRIWQFAGIKGTRWVIDMTLFCDSSREGSYKRLFLRGKRGWSGDMSVPFAAGQGEKTNDEFS